MLRGLSKYRAIIRNFTARSALRWAPSIGTASHCFLNPHGHFQPLPSFVSYRYFSTSGKGGQGEDGDSPPADPPPSTASDGVGPTSDSAPQPQLALSTQNVPDTFPLVPIIAITGAPLFPKFVKMIEVS
ncbi:Lon protease mitochondrial [Fasciola gigantica]|uniref:Lon protease mitochondrial n=1 Tax=Fasciola gigantica TaxID=46835 RepID=A0A504YUA9_FASGI|nr:Lon protease mitochondrial [Fasciola gigantica]